MYIKDDYAFRSVYDIRKENNVIITHDYDSGRLNVATEQNNIYDIHFYMTIRLSEWIKISDNIFGDNIYNIKNFYINIHHLTSFESLHLLNRQNQFRSIHHHMF